MIFVDTGAWYANLVDTDANHDKAYHWISSNRQPLLTTDYVFDEVMTLLRSHGHSKRAAIFGSQILEHHLFASLYTVSDLDFMAGWDIFRRYADKEWSFTDCVSFAVMQWLEITTAFAFDHHFRQFGSVAVVP